MSTTTMDTRTIRTRAEQLLLEYQREDRRIEWLLRGIGGVALALALLSVTTLLAN